VRIWIANLALTVWAFKLYASFPFYIIELGGTELLVGITAGGFALTSFVTRPLAGWLLDNKSRSGMLVFGTLSLLIVSLLLLVTPILTAAIILRMLSGLLFSGSITASTTNACDAIPQSRFGEGIGFLGLGNTLATALGPALGLAIIADLGYPHLFASSMAVALLAALTTKGFKFKKIVRTSPAVVRGKEFFASLINFDALPAAIVMAFSVLPYGGVSVFIALYGEHSGLGSGALFFVLLSLGTGSTRLFSGKIVDKKGEQPMIMSGNCGLLLALILLLVDNSVCYYLSGLFFGIGFGISSPALQAMAMRIVPMEKRGSATSTFQCSYDVAGGLGGPLAGVLVTYFGYRPMFAALCVFILISTLIYVFWASRTPSAFRVYQRNMRN